MDRCPICKKFKFASHHICPPRWHVWIMGVDFDQRYPITDPTTIKPVYAHTASEAAEARVARWDDGEFAYQESEIEVVVYDHAGENPQHFDVQGEMKPFYNASESFERKAAAR